MEKGQRTFAQKKKQGSDRQDGSTHDIITRYTHLPGRL